MTSIEETLNLILSSQDNITNIISKLPSNDLINNDEIFIAINFSILNLADSLLDGILAKYKNRLPVIGLERKYLGHTPMTWLKLGFDEEPEKSKAMLLSITKAIPADFQQDDLKLMVAKYLKNHMS